MSKIVAHLICHLFFTLKEVRLLYLMPILVFLRGQRCSRLVIKSQLFTHKSSPSGEEATGA